MFVYRLAVGIIGWLAGIILRSADQQGTLLHGLAVFVPAFLLALVLSPLLGIGAFGQVIFGNLLLAASLLGAMKLLAADQPLPSRLVALMP